MLRTITIGLAALSLAAGSAVPAQAQPSTAADQATSARRDVSQTSFKTYLIGLAAFVGLLLALEIAFDEDPVSP